ncbi:MAG: hypothetical protein NTV51_28800 [Verrucomicrobia bacterium]|nr:hypothetical protein [Verrucomicrobiota bacterium]
MDNQTALIGGGMLVVLVLGFFYIFRGKGEFSLKTLFGSAKAKGENPPPAKTVASGVKIKEAEAGGDLTAHSSSEGGVELEKTKAKGGIKATHTPGASPPKV